MRYPVAFSAIGSPAIGADVVNRPSVSCVAGSLRAPTSHGGAKRPVFRGPAKNMPGFETVCVPRAASG
jgi:hypothetical protein